MINWFQNKNTERDEGNVLAAYGEALETAFKEIGHENVFDIKRLPYPKQMIKAAIKDALEQDPNDKTLRKTYLYLAQFQPMPEVEGDDAAADAAEEKLFQVVDAETEQLTNELKRI